MIGKDLTNTLSSLDVNAIQIQVSDFDSKNHASKQQRLLRYGKYSSEGAAREWSTVVNISIHPPSFKPVPLSLSRSSLCKTPKQVFFNPIHIWTLLPHFSLIIINKFYFFHFNVNFFNFYYSRNGK